MSNAGSGQTRRQALKLASALVLTATALGCSAHAQPDGDWQPFVYADGIRLAGLANGQEVRILLDSGVSSLVLDRAAAQRLGVAVADGTVRADGFAQSVEAGLSGPFDLSVSGHHYAVRSAVLGDFSAFAGAGAPFDILLGLPAFENFYIDIDFATQRIAFRTAPPPAVLGMPYLPLVQDGFGLRALEVAVGDGHPPLQALVDLGASGALMVSKAYSDGRDLLAGRPQSRWIAAGIDGLIEFDVASVPRARLGTVELKDMPVDVHSAWLRDFPGNVGYEALSQFSRIVTDYSENRLYYVASTEPQRPFAKNRSGIAAVFDGERCRVVFIAPGSPAEQTGWQGGDIFVALDGVPLSEAYDRRWGEAPAGTTVAIRMADGSERRLVFADYY
jgi:hypothetical protein